MKIAFHFDYTDDSLKNKLYVLAIIQVLIPAIVENEKHAPSSKVFVGDLLLGFLAYKTKSSSSTQIVQEFDPDTFEKVLDAWISPEYSRFNTLSEAAIESACKQQLFTFCFESIDTTQAKFLDKMFTEKCPSYRGAIEVDETSQVHWSVYSGSLIMMFRIMDRKLYVFYSGGDDGKDASLFELFSELAPEFDVEYESTNGKHSIFDKYHDFNHAKRVAILKNSLGDYLAFMVDEVLSRLGDSCPQLSNKLSAAINTFMRAETIEEYAQVSATCRRILEYVIDQLFPPVDADIDGSKLGKMHYRNRLLAFAEKERKSNTNIDLICVSTAMLREQTEKLEKLVNKGIHADIFQHECRRCIIRTITILDDICSLRSTPFDIIIEDSGVFDEYFKNKNKNEK